MVASAVGARIGGDCRAPTSLTLCRAADAIARCSTEIETNSMET